MKENKEKVGLNTVEWILSIAGIIVLSCLVILPPAFRIFLKENKVEEDIPKEVDILTLTCTKKNYYSGVVRKNDTYTIKYYKDKVRTYTIKTNTTFSDPAPYDTVKQEEGELSTAYGLVEGINYTVTRNEENLRITTEESCDLSIFKSTSVTLPTSTNEIKVNSAFTTKDSVEQIKIDLEHDGYKCK